MPHLFYKIFLIFLLLLSDAMYSIAQTHTIKGIVKDAETKEDLPGAYIYISSQNLNASSDNAGNFTFLVKQDTILINFEFAGYVPQQKKIYLTNDTLLQVFLSAEGEKLDEIVIEGNRLTNQLNRTQMSISSIDSKDAKLIPVFFGEVDLLKTLQL